MKKYILCAMALWFSLLCIQVSAKTNDKVAYTIYYGSDTRNTYQIKEDVRQISRVCHLKKTYQNI